LGCPSGQRFVSFFTGGFLCLQRKTTMDGRETTPFQGEGGCFSIWSSMF